MLLNFITHNKNINSAKFSSDGKYIVTAGKDSVAKVWDLYKAKLLFTLKGHQSAVKMAEFSPDLKYIVTTGLDGTAKLWTFNDGKLKYTFVHETIYPITYNGVTYTEEMQREGREIVVSLAKFAPQGNLVFTTGDNNEVFAWSTETGKRIFHLNRRNSYETWKTKIADYNYYYLNTSASAYYLFEKPVESMDFTKNGKYMITSGDGMLNVWLIKNGQYYGQLLYSTNVKFEKKNSLVYNRKTYTRDIEPFLVKDVLFVKYCNNDKWALVAHEDGELNIWDIDSQKIINSFTTVGKTFNKKIWSDEGVYIDSLKITGTASKPVYLITDTSGRYAAVVKEKEVAVWDIKEAALKNIIPAINWGRFGKLSFNNDASVLAIENETNVMLYNIAADMSMGFLRTENKYLGADFFSPDGNFLFAGSGKNGATVIDMNRLRILADNTGEHYNSAFLANRFLISIKSFYYRHFGILDLVTGETEQGIETPGDHFLHRGHTGKFASFGSLYESGISVVDLHKEFTEEGRLPGVDINHGYTRFSSGPVIYNKGFSDDDSVFFTVGKSTSLVKFWNSATGNLLDTLTVTSNGNYHAMSTDHRYFSLIKERDIYIYDLKSLSRAPRIISFTKRMNVSKFSNDSRLIVVAEGDDSKTETKAFLIRTEDGKILSEYNASVKQPLFDNQANHLWLLNYDGTVQRVDLSTLLVDEKFKLAGWFRCFDQKRRRLIASSSVDNALVFHDMDGQVLFSVYAFNKDEYFIKTPDNFYAASKNIVRQTSIAINGQLYSCEQFDIILNRPDKVLQAMGCTDTSLIRSYYSAWLTRLQRQNLNPDSLSLTAILPEITQLRSPAFSSTHKPEYTVSFGARDDRDLLTKVKIWINSNPVFGSKGLPIARSHQVEKSLPVTLSAGINKIEVAVVNNKGIESAKRDIIVNYLPAKKQKPDLYLISVASDIYSDTAIRALQYAVSDGRDLVRYFTSSERKTAYNNIYIDTLFNADAEKQNISRLRARLSKAGAEDIVIMHFAGHGVPADSNLFFFVTYNTKLSNPVENGFSYARINSLLDSVAARKKIVFLDACYSGEMLNSEFLAPYKDTSGRGLIVDGPEQDSLSQAVFDLYLESFFLHGFDNGAVVISATTGNTTALEGRIIENGVTREIKNGVMTYCLLNGLQNNAADRNRNGTVSVSEISAYIKAKVAQLSLQKQKPHIRQDNPDSDWNLW